MLRIYKPPKFFLNGGQKVFNDHFKLIISLTKLAVDLKVESFIHIGSSDEYGKNRSPIKENVREDPYFSLRSR